MCRSSMCGSTPSKVSASNVLWDGSSVSPASDADLAFFYCPVCQTVVPLCPHSCEHNLHCPFSFHSIASRALFSFFVNYVQIAFGHGSQSRPTNSSSRAPYFYSEYLPQSLMACSFSNTNSSLKRKKEQVSAQRTLSMLLI